VNSKITKEITGDVSYMKDFFERVMCNNYVHIIIMRAVGKLLHLYIFFGLLDLLLSEIEIIFTTLRKQY